MDQSPPVTHPSRKALDSRRLLRRRTKISKPLFRGKNLVEDLEHYKVDIAYIKKEIKLRTQENNVAQVKELEKELEWFNHLVKSYTKKINSIYMKRQKGWRALMRLGWAGPTALKKLHGIKKAGITSVKK